MQRGSVNKVLFRPSSTSSSRSCHPTEWKPKYYSFNLLSLASAICKRQTSFFSLGSISFGGPSSSLALQVLLMVRYQLPAFSHLRRNPSFALVTFSRSSLTSSLALPKDKATSLLCLFWTSLYWVVLLALSLSILCVRSASFRQPFTPASRYYLLDRWDFAIFLTFLQSYLLSLLGNRSRHPLSRI